MRCNLNLIKPSEFLDRSEDEKVITRTMTLVSVRINRNVIPKSRTYLSNLSILFSDR